MNENDFYIAGDNLPELLPNDQLYELLDKAKQGDEDALKIVAEHQISFNDSR